MANKKQGNLFMVNDTSSQVDLQKASLKIVGVILTNASVLAAITLQIANYASSSPTVVVILKLSNTEPCRHFDFSDSPLLLSDGLSIPASGLTSGATATFIYEN